MFKYNVLSDLKDGTCVVPFKKEGNNIFCKTEDNIEITKFLSDFDFEKKVEDRGYVLAEEVTIIMEKDLKEPLLEKEIPIATNRKKAKISIETQIIRGLK